MFQATLLLSARCWLVVVVLPPTPRPFLTAHGLTAMGGVLLTQGGVLVHTRLSGSRLGLRKGRGLLTHTPGPAFTTSSLTPRLLRTRTGATRSRSWAGNSAAHAVCCTYGLTRTRTTRSPSLTGCRASRLPVRRHRPGAFSRVQVLELRAWYS